MVEAVGSIPCVMPQLGHRLAVFVYVEEAIKAGWIVQVNGRNLASMPHWFVIWPSCHVPNLASYFGYPRVSTVANRFAAKGNQYRYK